MCDPFQAGSLPADQAQAKTHVTPHQYAMGLSSCGHFMNFLEPYGLFKILFVRCWPNSSHILSHQHACQNLSLIIQPIRLKIDDPQLQYRAKDLIIPAHDA